MQPNNSAGPSVMDSPLPLLGVTESSIRFDNDKCRLVPSESSSSTSGSGTQPPEEEVIDDRFVVVIPHPAVRKIRSKSTGLINEAFQNDLDSTEPEPELQKSNLNMLKQLHQQQQTNHQNYLTRYSLGSRAHVSYLMSNNNGDSNNNHQNTIKFVGHDGPSPEPEKEKKKIQEEKKEAYVVQSAWSVFKQMLIPFTIAGIGSVFAGVVLNGVTKWSVFMDIPQLSILVSAFLGLIGNIETTLASRLSTQANLGRMDNWSGIRSILFGNIMVVQCQASTVGLFAAICSLAISAIRHETRKKLSIESVILLCSTSVCTSIISNTMIATIIIIVILTARKLNINPDNISTPVAASMGDVCTISILAHVSQFLYEIPDGRYYQLTLMALCLSLAPVFGYFARQSRWTRSVIYTGWTAILGAVIIEQPGGVVMESAFHQYKVLSTFQPLVNGIGSNLVGIQTSRMSTFLHASAPKGQLPASHPNFCVSPWFVFFSNDIHARMARLLMLVIIPAHLFYMSIIYLLQGTFDFSVIITWPFMTVYLSAVVLQLIMLLYLAYFSVFGAWKYRINPDNSAIPFTSALADVLGNCLMALAFTLLKAINDPNVNLLEPFDNSTLPLGPSYIIYENDTVVDQASNWTNIHLINTTIVQ